MDSNKKVWNVLGIIAAWLLSIILVLMLIISPMILSVLSLLNADTITDVLADSLTAGAPSAQAQPEVITLSTASQAQTPTDMLTGMLGDNVTPEQLDKILSSKVAKELIGSYTKDMANAFGGGNQAPEFDAEKLKTIVNDNIDEVVGILKELSPELADVDEAEIKANIQKAVDEGAEEIVSALPKPEEIKQEIMQNSPELGLVFKVIAKKNLIKLAIIGMIVLLSGLIFVCRLCGFRGFRWLAVDLFVGAGFGILICAGLLFGASMLDAVVAGEPIVGALIGTLLSAFTKGMIIRTVVMLLSAVGLLLAYIFVVKKALTKKTSVLEAAPVEETPNEAEQQKESLKGRAQHALFVCSNIAICENCVILMKEIMRRELPCLKNLCGRR